ncbi:hypothetical protein [Gynuella sp.]|uniref:hypothetical protein n=1 Tax=Gynuella sp. TaxID=2969146 RepID=UPI003D0E724D
MKSKDISALYENVDTPVMSQNKLSDLLHNPSSLSDKLLFALGIKNAPVNIKELDSSSLDNLLASAKSLGYEVEVLA